MFELQRVPKNRRRQEKELLGEFEKARGQIIGGIFDAVATVMKIVPSLKFDDLSRMADFVVWGCAIAEALGYTQREFLDAYNGNIKSQNEEVLYESLTANTLMLLMATTETWEGSPSALLNKLVEIALAQGVNITKEPEFPKAANVLSRRLNKLKTNLADVGIEVKSGGEDHERRIYLRRTSEYTVANVESSEHVVDDSDDVFANL